jgi:leucyl aminopeptidase
MQIGIKAGNPVKSRSQCVVIGLYENSLLSPTAKLLDRASKGYIRKVINRGDLTGKIGQTITLHDVRGINAARVMLVGLGNPESADASKYIQIVNATIAALKRIPVKNTLCCLLEAEAGAKDLTWKTRRLVEQFNAAVYLFTDMKGEAANDANGVSSDGVSSDGVSSNGDASKLDSVELQLADKNDRATVLAAIGDANAVAAGIAFAKDLGNTPGNLCTPGFLADKAQDLAKSYESLTTKILDEKEMEKLGMGALLSVGKGSEQASKLIVIQHKGAKPKDQPHVLVGKGITFDSGGISLKSAGAMAGMIFDMCGAASVFGAMNTVAELDLPINVIGVIAAAENMPSGQASRPGDIVKSMSGQTIEILNTDAEGRLVLSDALTYIDKFNPATVIDIATLTGACITALGSHPSALYANDDELAGNINQAGDETYDRVWRMPLWDEYQKQISSAFADMANVGGPEAGSITAACFLSRFTKKYRWAHLDIAGTAFKGTGPQKGSTGRPVPLLTQYLMDRANDAAQN